MGKILSIGIAVGILVVAGIFFVVLRWDGTQQNIQETPRQEEPTVLEDESEENPFVVIITEKGFEPSMIEVGVGNRIVWFNEGTQPHWPASDVHPTHEAYPELDPKASILPGELWEFVAGEAGEWTIHDHLNPDNTATVRITE